MYLAARMDEYGRPGWIALTILAFCLYWPVGLAILAYLFWSGRMGCWKHERRDRWGGHRGGWEQMTEAADRWFGGARRAPSSGNWAFDEYRAETIRRLEDEQREFLDFLQRLRRAKDKAEFDEFLAERRRRPDAPGPEGVSPQPPI
jgi:hypothetical protein